MVEAICGLVGALLDGGLSILGNWWLETRREQTSTAMVHRAVTLSASICIVFVPPYGLIWNPASSNLKFQERGGGRTWCAAIQNYRSSLMGKTRQLCHDYQTEISQTVRQSYARQEVLQVKRGWHIHRDKLYGYVIFYCSFHPPMIWYKYQRGHF